MDEINNIFLNSEGSNSIRINGGLGNQLFQIFFVIILLKI